MAEEKQARIFLSYTRKDMVKVKNLYRKLKGYGFSPWIDIEDIIGGDWWKVTKKAIKEASFFVICLSKHSVSHRGVVQREIKEGLKVWEDKLEEDIFLIPVRLENCEVPEQLAKFQWFDFYGVNKEDGFEKLVRALRHGLKQLGIDNPLNLRSQPLENLSQAEASQMIRERNFYDYSMWPSEISFELSLKSKANSLN
jgi:hypothetical protein